MEGWLGGRELRLIARSPPSIFKKVGMCTLKRGRDPRDEGQMMLLYFIFFIKSRLARQLLVPLSFAIC